MKKTNLILVMLSLITCLSAYTQQQKTCFSILSDFIYAMRKSTGRNDYAFLASRPEYTGLLKEKINRKEALEDVDRYYIRSVNVINGVAVPCYHTPLHEAILSSNFKAVQELCAAGADKNKTAKENVDQELAQESRHLGFPRRQYAVNPHELAREIDIVRQRQHIGISALKLAKKVMQQKDPYADAQTIKARQDIYKYLKRK